MLNFLKEAKKKKDEEVKKKKKKRDDNLRTNAFWPFRKLLNLIKKELKNELKTDEEGCKQYNMQKILLSHWVVFLKS